MGQRDPVWGVLREQGRYNLVWLARVTGYSHSHVKAMASGAQPTSPRFRSGCARVLGMRESDLFQADDSSASPSSGDTEQGSDDDRAGSAVVRESVAAS